VIGRCSHSEFRVDEVIREETNEDFNTLESNALNRLIDEVQTPRSPVGKSKYVNMPIDIQDASSSSSGSSGSSESDDAEIMMSRSSRRERQSENSFDKEISKY